MLKVLLVEDDLIAQHVEKSMLKSLGCSVDIAGTVAMALEMATSTDTENYNIIFTDIGLPDTSGVELIRTIRQLNNKLSQIPIIALTGLVGHEEKKNFLATGANEVAHKPISTETLQSILIRYGAFYS